MGDPYPWASSNRPCHETLSGFSGACSPRVRVADGPVVPCDRTDRRAAPANGSAKGDPRGRKQANVVPQATEGAAAARPGGREARGAAGPQARQGDRGGEARDAGGGGAAADGASGSGGRRTLRSRPPAHGGAPRAGPAPASQAVVPRIPP